MGYSEKYPKVGNFKRCFRVCSSEKMTIIGEISMLVFLFSIY